MLTGRATFWGRSAVLQDWATLLRTFRPRCQIGLPFEDVQTVLPDWATFSWGRSDRIASIGLPFQLRTDRIVNYFSYYLLQLLVSTISASTTTFRFFYYFSFYYYFQILLLFQLLLLLSDSSDQFILHLCFAIIVQLPAFTRVFCRKCIF